MKNLNADTEREEGEEFEDNMDVFDDSSSSPSGTLRNYPLTCKVVYSYKACLRRGNAEGYQEGKAWRESTCHALDRFTPTTTSPCSQKVADTPQYQ
ncbi:hypothetical protein P7K49_022277 [Saguinus oedipus]|uniref:Uncharacterized protein n=1 Tax=Saguinus oedipus TaxID=9490 RepID=A0ABQ9UVV6_SAGOE|nr:hypothetical protein P7K49_022277 [Saguinus oedipus]